MEAEFVEPVTGVAVSILADDLAGVVIPFDLYTGITIVTDELERRGFIYSHLLNDDGIILKFKNEVIAENISITIERENLLIRQFSIEENNNRKLKVIYVIKPSERTFKLV